MKIHQAENFTASRQFLSDPSNRNDLIISLNKFLEGKNFENVGLITYSPYAPEISEALGIPPEKTGYFGKIRGHERWYDCDCLLVIGRHNLHSHLASKARALSAYINGTTWSLFGLSDKEIETRAPTSGVVKMDNGSLMTLPKQVYTLSIVEELSIHLARAETLQAISKIGLSTGEKERHVYLFSCEPLGLDIEITDFFRRDDILAKLTAKHSGLPKDRVSRCKIAVENMKKYGCLELSNSGKILKKYWEDLGFYKNDIQYYMEDIRKYFEENGIEFVTLPVRKPKKTFQERNFFIVEGLCQETAIKRLGYKIKNS